MIEMLTAHTLEIDEIDVALDEIFQQIDFGKLKKHSVGLINCYYDYVESGVVEALCRKLPFDVVGMTTMACQVKGTLGQYRFCLTVLTSDEVSFETALSEPLSGDNYEKSIAAAYQQARNRLPDAPALIIAYLPVISDVSGSYVVKAFDKACNGVPIWGGLTMGVDMSYEHCRTIRNGVAEQFSLGMVLVCGPVEPEFVLVSIPEKNIRNVKGVVTESDGCVLKSINDTPVLSYLQSLGITLLKESSTTFPLMVYHSGDAKPVALGIFTINDDGSVVCGGEMPVGAHVAVAALTTEGIMETAKESMAKILACKKEKQGLLMLPCVTRYLMTMPNQDDEMEFVAKVFETGAPYMLGYAGGEICPVKTETGGYSNRFHNYTFSACLL